MAHKLSSRQQAQLAFLERLPPKFQRMHGIIEQMGGLKVDETIFVGSVGCWTRSRATHKR